MRKISVEKIGRELSYLISLPDLQNGTPAARVLNRAEVQQMCDRLGYTILKNCSNIGENDRQKASLSVPGGNCGGSGLRVSLSPVGKIFRTLEYDFQRAISDNGNKIFKS